MRRKRHQLSRELDQQSYQFPDYEEFDTPIRYDRIHSEQVDNYTNSLEWDSKRRIMHDYSPVTPVYTLAKFVPQNPVAQPLVEGLSPVSMTYYPTETLRNDGEWIYD